MAASYPAAVKTFVNKVDFTDTVLAEHINSIQDEVNAIEANLGTYIKTGSGWIGSVDFVTSAWDTLKDRLANIEYGLKDVYDTYVSTAGGSTITTATAETKGLIIKAAGSQTANLLELQTSDSTIVTRVNSAGHVFTRGVELVPVIYSASEPTGASFAAGTIWVDSSVDVDITSASAGAAFSELLLIGA